MVCVVSHRQITKITLFADHPQYLRFIQAVWACARARVKSACYAACYVQRVKKGLHCCKPLFYMVPAPGIEPKGFVSHDYLVLVVKELFWVLERVLVPISTLSLCAYRLAAV